ncbi:calmodulin-binding protein 60 G-like isoform X3 [Panicum virgatum]|uniref:calmodulin-binding protein 60 G-like isoform X3 n=1 Tax=Panicum virgatum TaxID=38727 RepID=UPI0019D658DD|nr:calmodulin-binding protein 60 G-like isoform X3 [Panicum virgatum]
MSQNIQSIVAFSNDIVHRREHSSRDQYYSFIVSQQQRSLEQGGYGAHRGMDPFTEKVNMAMMKINEGNKMREEGNKVIEEGFKSLLGMKPNWSKRTRYADHHPARLEAAGPSSQAHNINEERPCQNHKFKLCFHGSLKSCIIYTNIPILAQSNEGIEIVICRDDQIISLGHLASLTVEIVALESDHSCKGEWTEEDFDRQIRKSRDGGESVLDGERLVKLVNGKASLGNIRFKEGSTGTRTREFVLAARVCRSENIGGPRVEEAFMHPPFTVKVERSKANEKSPLPKLDDKVYCLKGIAKGGVYHKRLEQKNICKVQDFLKAFNRDPDQLRQVLNIELKKHASWATIVEHAMKCDLTDKNELKSYKVETENVTLFFNCVDDLIGAEFHDNSDAEGKFKLFNENQKAKAKKWLKQAYNKLDAIEFDYAMDGNRPVKIFSNIIAAAGSTSIPILLGPTQQNTPTPSHHSNKFQGSENFVSSPSSGMDCAPGLPLGDANRNAARPTASGPSH